MLCSLAATVIFCDSKVIALQPSLCILISIADQFYIQGIVSLIAINSFGLTTFHDIQSTKSKAAKLKLSGKLRILMTVPEF